MPVGVVDVGSNTVRLLVARPRKGGVASVHEQREQLGLGEDVERLGRISPQKLREAERVVASLVEQARTHGCARLEVLVTSPGRQAANGEELAEVLEQRSGQAVRILTAEEEARLAYAGAVAAARPRCESVAVVDVGGGSAQLIVGTASAGPVWVRSVELGSLRLTRRLLPSDPPRARELDAARREVERSFTGVAPPVPLAALATGGSARALRRMLGKRRLAERHLDAALRELAKRDSRELARRYGLAPERARTLTAGTLILAEAQKRVRVPLEVARGGLREGAALALLAERAAA